MKTLIIFLFVAAVCGCSTVTREEQLNSLDMNIKNLTPSYRPAPVVVPMPVIIYQQRHNCLNANC